MNKTLKGFKTQWILKSAALCGISLGMASANAQQSCGDLVDSGYLNVPIFANQSCTGEQNEFGELYQCVEYVRRFYGEALGADTVNWPRIGNAHNYVDRADELGLVGYDNGGSTPPRVNDIVVFEDPRFEAGHVGIISDITGSTVTIHEQNWGNDALGTLTLEQVNGTYSLSRPGSDYTVLGWSRLPGNGCSVGDISGEIVFSTPVEVATFDGSGFDATRTADGAWVEQGGVERVYYAGVPFGNTQDLGLATSSDGGSTWTKATSTGLIPRSTAPNWARQRIVPIRVLFENGVFRLWFSANNTNLFSQPDNIQGFGYASSSDGINWTVTEQSIRQEAGANQGAALMEVIKLGDRYKAYYLDLSPGEDQVTYVADSANGELFVGPDQRVPFGDQYRLVAGASRAGETCALTIWRDRANGNYVAAVSTSQSEFQIVASVTLPANITPNDIRFEGNQIVLYGSRFDGNVNWNFGNISLVELRADVF